MISAVIQVTQGTADPNEDYTLAFPVVLNFAPQSTGRTFSVVIHADEQHEASEYVQFDLSVTKGNALIGIERHGLLIQNDAVNADGDCMPDWWEIRYFGSITNANEATDYDGDNVLDCDEFELGMDPTILTGPDTNNVLHLQIITPVLDR